MRRRPQALAAALLWLSLTLALPAAAADCPEDQQGQGRATFGSGRHLVAYVVLSTCDLLDRAVKPTPAEVRRYLEVAASAADQQDDWHANYSCPADGQEAAYPAAVERHLQSPQSQDTLFDLPVDVASSAADCFSEADAGERACAPCADFLNLRSRLRGALSAKAEALANAVTAAAVPARCAQAGADAACREWQRQRAPVGLLGVSVLEAAEAALRLWGRVCASAGGCCGPRGHAIAVRDQLFSFQAALDDAVAAALQRAVGDALGAARQVAGRARLGAAAAAALEEARRGLGAALRDLRAVVGAARRAQREALGAALLGGGCGGGGGAGAAAAEAAAWALARRAVGGTAARLLGAGEERWGGAARGFTLTARRGLRALQLALCQAQRIALAGAELSQTVVAMLAHSDAPPPTPPADAPLVVVAAASTLRVTLLLSVAAVLPARFVL